jgi:urease accessory protein
MPDSILSTAPPATATHTGWRAELDLEYRFADERTALTRRRHFGPLRVQKPLYPEGAGVCHTIIVHPPGGIAGGDGLDISLAAGVNAQVLVTTPGATKWYKANGRPATQDVRLKIDSGALIEWLPQETIVFDGANAQMKTIVNLAHGARYIGWEILVLGRRASGEKFAAGCVRQQTTLLNAGREIFAERSRIEGSDPLLESPVGLTGCHVLGTLIAAGAICPENVIERCREIVPADGARHALTRLPGALVARYLGSSPQSARAYFFALWQQLRPWLAGRDAVPPRIWNT